MRSKQDIAQFGEFSPEPVSGFYVDVDRARDCEPEHKLNEPIHWRTTSEGLMLCAELAFVRYNHELRRFHVEKGLELQKKLPFRSQPRKQYLFLGNTISMLESMAIEAAMKGILVQEGVIDYSLGKLGGPAKLGNTHDLERLAEAISDFIVFTDQERTLITEISPYTELGRYPGSFRNIASGVSLNLEDEWDTFYALVLGLQEQIRIPKYLWDGTHIYRKVARRNMPADDLHK